MPEELWLEDGALLVPYIPDFLLKDLIFYFSPSRDAAVEVYHSLSPLALDRWSSYFTKKGWNFIKSEPENRKVSEGPYRVQPEKFAVEMLSSGRFFLPRPLLRIDDKEIPIVSLEKRRPFNEWKPNYIRALNFIKKYSPERPITKLAEFCIWEIEECGEVSGSTSWENAELLLKNIAKDSEDDRIVIADIFKKRPEDFPLGSEVYLRILGSLDDAGFQIVCDLHKHPQSLKRRHVAAALGRLKKPEGLETLVQLLDDHEVEVRETALNSIGKVGIPTDHSSREKVQSFLEDEEISHRVWASEALLRGGDENQEKHLIGLVKEEAMPLYNMGDLGHILKDLKLFHAVPFLIKRLKSDRIELRDDAAEALREVTGLDLEYYSDGDPNQRRQAVKEWKNWWEEYKKNRKKEVSG